MKNPVQSYWKTLGPGLTTGAADDDPSGIATYSQVGAARGFGLLWLALFSLPFMAVVNEMCARIGIVTGVGLAANMKRRYSRHALYFCTFLLMFANIFNIGADLGAMGKATGLLFPGLPFGGLVVLFAALTLFLQIVIPYRKYSKYLKYLTLVLFTYVLSALSVRVDWGAVAYQTLVPHLHFAREDLVLICAMLGTTISPYLFFWQTSQEVEDEIKRGDDTEESRRAHVTRASIRDMHVDVWSGAFISNVVMFFIIVVCGAVLFGHGITNITSAEQAAQALRPFAGNLTYLLFTLGIVGTGLLAIPVLAGSVSYAVSESFRWSEGLYRTFFQARAFYGVIIAAMVSGITLNFIGLDPIKALIYAAVLNGLVAPVMLFFIVRLSSSREVMGPHANSAAGNVFGWATFALMSLVAVSTLVFILV